MSLHHPDPDPDSDSDPNPDPGPDPDPNSDPDHPNWLCQPSPSLCPDTDRQADSQHYLCAGCSDDVDAEAVHDDRPMLAAQVALFIGSFASLEVMSESLLSAVLVWLSRRASPNSL